MRDGGGALLIATPARRARFEHSLEAIGNVDALMAAGRYHAADAQQTLRSILVDGAPDPDRFHTTVGEVLARAAATGAPLRAFGEMVALLWNDGNVAGAIELEALWNDLATGHSFSLCCAYPMATLEAADDLVSAQQVCTSHTAVIGPSPRTPCGLRTAIVSRRCSCPRRRPPVMPVTSSRTSFHNGTAPR